MFQDRLQWYVNNVFSDLHPTQQIHEVSRIEEDAYSVYIDSSKVHMELEKKRYINVMWLPGQEEWYGNSHKVFQISEEDFNKVVEKYNEMVKVAKEIKAT